MKITRKEGESNELSLDHLKRDAVVAGHNMLKHINDS